MPIGCSGRMAGNDPEWEHSKLLARAMLMLAAGLWLIDEWLLASPLRFLCWWGVCAIATGVVMLFAIYDALAAIREERDRYR